MREMDWYETQVKFKEKWEASGAGVRRADHLSVCPSLYLLEQVLHGGPSVH